MEQNWIVLAKTYEGGVNVEYGAPYWNPNKAGYTHRISAAGLYTQVEAESIAEGTHGDHIAYAVDSPKLLDYLTKKSLVRASELTLWLELRALRTTQQPAACTCLWKAGHDRRCPAYNAYVDGMQYAEQPAASEAAWVSVVERLPEVAQKVLVCFVYGDGTQEVKTSFLNAQHGCFDEFQWERISHWMPLPNPPSQT
ncbi:DUF551 domain-containing protein [Hymenobacter metallicola]|uniref:DUF551 domain-containing protein n=1 Tax=Hymenobacter metallicola TaxID=2563114 RepID=A0A4Z0QK16_9BACT|nr:DUF551 domain-containing protein [Hymenobacter metallicola]TGE29846.1 DUF551 domain-containing protein [Hymenobacter metallicola]